MHIFVLFPTLAKNLIPSTSRWNQILPPSADCIEFDPRFLCDLGDLMQNLVSAHTKYLCVHLRLILHFEVGVSVTTDFPVNWSQCQRPWKHPIFEGVYFLKLSLLRRLPLKGFFAAAKISFDFSVLSVLNGGDAQKVNPSSDLKSYLKASLAP